VFWDSWLRLCQKRLIFGDIAKLLLDVCNFILGIWGWLYGDVGFPSFFCFLLLLNLSGGVALVNLSVLHRSYVVLWRTVSRVQLVICRLFEKIRDRLDLVARFTFFAFLGLDLQFLCIFIFYLLQNLLNGRTNYCNYWPLVRLLFQKRYQKLLDRRPNTLISDFEGHFEYFIKNFFIVFPRVEGSPMQNLIKDDSQRPNINSICIVVKLSLLRGYVLLSTCDCFHYYFLSTQPEICQLD